ncbi:acyl-CoA dehydrogenase [Streptomyces sp. MST-110588]|uniref:acyl-CoA dehydrogenase n=1 Tax=Streptomyces sp. MST-110588 TaxID=2833628 RepID=UPI001F5D241A|nr:acyl-CoA dehydrogenase [Streptomyces sp. MST-110588]UNO41406.1 acyl-CoA dehydrogenase family protein [Streptomyces sp. MST-110588]
MDFRLTDDQEALRRAMRDLLARRFGPDRLREAVRDPALDRSLWRELGTAGFFDLRLPEADGAGDGGGAGLGLPEAVLVFEEAGRALLPGPLVAGHLLAGVVPGCATGERVVGLCDLAARPPLWEHPADCDELILLVGGGAEGGGPGVDGPGVDGPEEDGPGAAYRAGSAAYRAGSYGPKPAPFRSVDPLTPLARVVSCDPSRMRPLDVDVPRLRREAALLTAALQLGSAARTLEAAVEHARRREQFGVPVGSFQAVQHLCADMLVRVEIARSAVYAASAAGVGSRAGAGGVTGAAGTTGAPETAPEPLAVSGAKLLADDAAVRNARDCLQVYGGMGFTWEAEVHLHLKRAWLRAEQWQTPAGAAQALAAGLVSGVAEVPDGDRPAGRAAP